MKINIKDIKQIPINCVCFSDDGKYMYGFSKYYNEFFETDILNHSTRSLGKLDEEIDIMELMFQLLYYKRKIIFIPRLAKYVHIYDCESKNQYKFAIRDIINRNQYNYAGFFHVIYDEFLYLIHRDPIIVSKLNLETLEFIKVIDDIYIKEKFISLHNSIEKYAACFVIDNNELLLFDAVTEKIKEITLPEECDGFTNPFFDGQFIWLYHLENDEIYKCDMSGKLLHKWILNHDLDKNGLYMIFKLLGSRLYLFPNKQGCYFQVTEQEIISFHYKEIDDKVCGLTGDDGKNPYFVCLDWNRKGNPTAYTTPVITNFTYRKLDLLTNVFEDIPIKSPEKIENSYARIMQSYINYFFRNSICGEMNVFSLDNFLEVLSDKIMKKERNCKKVKQSGEVIFKNMVNEKNRIYKT